MVTMRQRWIAHLLSLAKNFEFLIPSSFHSVNLFSVTSTLNVSSHKTVQFNKCFSNMTPYFSNKLPPSLKILSMTSSKNKMNEYIFENITCNIMNLVIYWLILFDTAICIIYFLQTYYRWSISFNFKIYLINYFSPIITLNVIHKFVFFFLLP